MKCLVVDDSPLTRRILVNSLRAIGFTMVLEAVDARTAIAQCTPDLDLVVTDWNMPGMTGVDLVRTIRADPRLARLPVLLVTARNVKDDVLEAVDAGVSGYVVKPFTTDGLRSRIDELLHRPGPSDAATGTRG